MDPNASRRVHRRLLAGGEEVQVSDLQLNGMLDNLASEGDCESVARSFTLSEKKALEKLRGSLAVPEYWTLKAVQAGVAAGCSGISFRIGRNLTEVQWSGLAPLSAAELAGALGQPTLSGNVFFDELLVGLRALVGYCEWEFLSDGTLVVGPNQQLEITPNQGIITTLRVKHPGEVNYLGFRSQKTLKATAEQAGLLRERCSFCPIPVRLDGKLVQHHVERIFSTQEKLQWSKSPFLLADLELKPEGEGWVLAAPPQANRGFDPNRWDQPPVQNNSTYQLGTGRFVLWGNVVGRENPDQAQPSAQLTKEQGRVYWLRHGVVSASELLCRTSSLGLAISLDAGDARTDVSGLSVSEPPLRSPAILAMLVKLWKECEPAVWSVLNQGHGSYFSRPRLAYAAIGACFGVPVALSSSILLEILTGSLEHQAELMALIWFLCTAAGFFGYSEIPATSGGQAERLLRAGVTAFAGELEQLTKD